MTGGRAPVFLGVERSFTGKRWHERLADARLGLTLAQRVSVPEIIGRALAARGVGVEDAWDYLNPTLRETFPDPRHLIDMDVAVERLVRAVRAGDEKPDPVTISHCEGAFQGNTERFRAQCPLRVIC